MGRSEFSRKRSFGPPRLLEGVAENGTVAGFLRSRCFCADVQSYHWRGCSSGKKRGDPAEESPEEMLDSGAEKGI